MPTSSRRTAPLITLRRGRWSCCGAQNFCAALRLTLKILTAATRSLRFLCHRQRSVRSLHRPARTCTAPLAKLPVIARPVRTLAVAIRVPCLKPPLRKGRWREAPEGSSPPHPLFRTKRRGVEDAAPYEQTPFRQERYSLRLALIVPFSTFSFLPFFSPISVVILRRICYTILSKNNILPESRDAL